MIHDKSSDCPLVYIHHSNVCAGEKLRFLSYVKLHNIKLSKYARSNLEAFWLQLVMAITAIIGPDHTCWIQHPTFNSILFFQRRPRLYCVKLAQIKCWLNGSGPQKQASVQESLGPVLAECNRPATSFPLSDSVTFFHKQPGLYCAKPAQTSLVLADCARLAKTDPVKKQDGMQESSGQCFWAYLDWIRHIYGEKWFQLP